ncbi:MAG: 23S rRNA (uracil(1939)-C(5))-methyltransferase RlmD [Anaerolineae bacterium]|nr:23S rRNA (uracil(1939)-C(5))-methyltransferase RlmD [Anaerolineae bacterium]
MTETFTLQLTAIAHGGAALGRYEGQVIFVPYGLPGETVRVTCERDSRERYAFAQLVEVLTPAQDRTVPLCPYFGQNGCGGCQWQHIAYPAQLRYKASILADQLMRIGKITVPPVKPVLPAPSDWAYRNHARFHPAAEGLGFQAAGGSGVVAIEECLVLHPLLSELYAALDLECEGLLALSLRAGCATGDRMLVFEMEDDLPPALEIDVPVSCVLLLSDGRYVNLIGYNHITEIVAGHRYRISAPSFFQVNTAQAERLVQLVLEYAGLRGDETVLDAYCGVGLFTTHLAERAALVVGIELASAAVADLLENTAAQENVEVIEGPVEAVLPELDVPVDIAVVDPPRAGMERAALDALIERRPARIVYVSCDPATLARDARRLGEAGYRLVEVQPVDMFPQTYHIESVALFAGG